MAELDVAPADEFPPGAMKLVVAGAGLYVGVYNCGGQLYAIEDRCSHDDGPLCEGDWEEDECVVVCPRHGSRFDSSFASGASRYSHIIPSSGAPESRSPITACAFAIAASILPR